MKALSLSLLFVYWFCHAHTQGYQDQPFLQDYAEKYSSTDEAQLLQVRTDRNQVIQVLSTEGLLQPFQNRLVPELRYRPLTDQKLVAVANYQAQFVFLTNKALLSNAWAGRFYVEHGLEKVSHFAMGSNFSALLAAKQELILIKKGEVVWQERIKDFDPVQILFDEKRELFYLLSQASLYSFEPDQQQLKVLTKLDKATSMALDGGVLVIGTQNGAQDFDLKKASLSTLNSKLPFPEITSVQLINGRRWYGSKRGAFALRENRKYDYYASERWLPDDHVVDIAEGPDRSVLILTKKGLSKIIFKSMTLADKAAYFQQIQRLRHIRYGFTSTLKLTKKGDLSSGILVDTDNDGLWTSMYLAAELFRYAVTQSKDAKANAYEAFEAMERLTEISGIDGFPARTYELDSYQSSDREPDKPEGQKVWQLAKDERWRWKSSTSSDESCGHFFAFALFAELAPDQAWRDRAIRQIQIQMDHIIANDWYLVSYNGKPTRWGRWNPEYVNSFPIQVGDRRLNSTLILAFLQTAYHFTGKELYKEKAYELINKHGYLENILRPATVIGKVDGQFLSDSWNHSDDEMYFLTVPALVKYAFTEEMRQQYLETVRSHWLIERNEKNPLWNYLYALVGGKDYDMEDSAWWLREFPLDLISWNVDNSHRQDLQRIAPNFRKQQYTEVLPRDERPMHLHNRAYVNNKREGGMREYEPYIYLLPYWLGRYVGGIGD